MAFTDWNERWSAIERACRVHRASGRWAEGVDLAPRFEIDPPASEEQTAAIERELKQAIPSSLRRVLREYSARVDVGWQLPDDVSPPGFEEIFAGECRWDLASLVAAQQRHREWTTDCFADPSEPYDAVWHGKFAFASVANGDMLAIDIAAPDAQPVVYLSHADGEGHGYLLGASFEDFVERFTRLGCPGYEDWQWLYFAADNRSYLDPDGEAASRWKSWFGLK